MRERWTGLIGSILLAGPLLCGTSQACNDWFDRHVDAINEPSRPIPSGRLPGRWGLGIAIAWSGLSLVVAATLGIWVLSAAVLGLGLAWAYSAPPLRLKMNGWWGCAAVGLCYEGLPWFTGAAAMLGTIPPARSIALALLYSAGAFGIMVLNDFKAVEGDSRHGIRTLPVTLGVRKAALVAAGVMVLAQIVVVGLHLLWGNRLAAAAVATLVLAQAVQMPPLVAAPAKRAALYGATGVSLYVTGMMISAFAVR